MANFTFNCVSSCPPYYYNDSNACYQCIFPCSECKSTSQCLTCVPGTFYHNLSESCLMECPIGTFYDTSTSISLCTGCLDPCATCSNSATNCISCVSGYMLLDGSCTSSCPIKFYADPSGICNRCFGVC
jgi:proprotein convertase subtilisin/kexin type 5